MEIAAVIVIGVIGLVFVVGSFAVIGFFCLLVLAAIGGEVTVEEDKEA